MTAPSPCAVFGVRPRLGCVRRDRLADQFPQRPAEEVAVLAVDRRLAEKLGAQSLVGTKQAARAGRVGDVEALVAQVAVPEIADEPAVRLPRRRGALRD